LVVYGDLMGDVLIASCDLMIGLTGNELIGFVGAQVGLYYGDKIFHLGGGRFGGVELAGPVFFFLGKTEVLGRWSLVVFRRFSGPGK